MTGRKFLLPTILATLVLAPGAAYAGLFDNVPIIGPIVKEAKKIPVIGGIVTKVDETVETTVHAGGTVLNGVGKIATGRGKEGMDDIKNGVVEVLVSGVGTIVTVADPLIGTVFFGTPSPLQEITKFIYETIARWKGKPTCNAAEQVARLMIIKKNALGDGDRLAGAISTPAKYLSSIFEGTGAWQATGCDATGIGRPVRNAQYSTDGLWTVDLELLSFDVQDVKSPPGRYIRLEIIPGVPAHQSASRHKPTPADIIRFSGPMIWDKDKDGDHPHGHMEVHPYEGLEFGVRLGSARPKPTATEIASPPGIEGRAEQGTSRAGFGKNAALRDIHFDVDRSAIRRDDMKTLDAITLWLSEHPNSTVLIEGHCDDRGTDEYNVALGARRAMATQAFLSARGVAANRISIVSHGRRSPLCAEESESCRTRNRRAEFFTKAN